MTEAQTPSVVQAAIEGLEVFQREADITGFFSHAGQPIPKVIVRVPKKGAEMKAIMSAYQSAEGIARGAGSAKDLAKMDGDLLHELKMASIVWEAFRDPDDPSKPAFITAEWLFDTLDSDEIGCLLRLLEEVRKEKATTPWTIDLEAVETFLSLCGQADSDETIMVVMARMDRDFLASITPYAMNTWYEERASVELERTAWDEERASLQARIAKLEAPPTKPRKASKGRNAKG